MHDAPDRLTVEEEIPAVAAAPEVAPDAPSSPEPAPLTDDQGSPESGSASDEGQASAALAAPAEPAPQPTTIDPLGGDPFVAKVDGTELALTGAKAVGDFILIPRDTWDRELRPKYLGDRTAWRQKEQQYQRQVHELANARTDKEARADALSAKLLELFQNPDKLAAEYENWTQRGPVLVAEAQAEATRRQLEAYQAREREQQEQERERALEPELQNELGVTVERLLAEPEFRGVPEEVAVEFVRQMWATHQRFGYHQNGVFNRGPRGIEVNPDFLREALTREARRTRTEQVQAKTTERTKALNQAAVAPAKPTPGPTKTVTGVKAPAKAADKPNFNDPNFDFDEWYKHRRHS